MTNKTDDLFRDNIKSTSPAKGDMMFWRIVGHETLSRPSIYDLTVLSRNDKLDHKNILGHSFDVIIRFDDAVGKRHERHCQGYAVRFTRVGQLGSFYEYRIVLRSWFWLLTKRTNSRIMQGKSVVKIADEVFNDSPIKKAKKIDTQGVKEIGQREYCVQHQESDYQFLSRLFEDEGIHYWFDAHDTGDAANTMHLMSLSTSHSGMHLPANKTLEYVQGNFSGAHHNTIVHWINSFHQLDSAKYLSYDVNYEKIQTLVKVEGKNTCNHELDFDFDFEIFEYPGGHLADKYIEEMQYVRKNEVCSRSHYMNWALTHWPDVGVGRTFFFKAAPDSADGSPIRDNDEFLIATCTFVVSHPGYEGILDLSPQKTVTTILREALADDAVNAQRLDDFMWLIDTELRTNVPGTSDFLITVWKISEQFKPPRLTPRVTMPGPQSAIVVGPEGEELHVDEDRMGRVKVRFHWDRYDVKKKEDSTCWIRVSQPWAGKGWGGYFMPRIGQEVLVDFVNGDPDRPVIVGSLYNDDQPIPPYKPTQSGFRTHSTPDGAPTNFNELRFEDRKDGEQVFIHAERRMDVRIKRNKYETVQGTSNTLIGGRHILTIGKSLDLHVKENQYWRNNYHCEGSVAGDIRLINDGMTSAIIKKELSLSSPKIVLEAETEISMKVGGNCVVIDASGVSVDGKMVKINSGGYGSDASDVAINEPYDATGADNGEPGYLDRLPKGGGRSGRKIRHENACHAHTTPRPGEPEAITAMRQKLATTPEGRHALEVYDRYDVQATFIPEQYGGSYSGSKFNDKTVNMNPNNPGDSNEHVFVHEIGHAQADLEGRTLFGRETTTSLDDYLDSMLNEEANNRVLQIKYANSRRGYEHGIFMTNPPDFSEHYNDVYFKEYFAPISRSHEEKDAAAEAAGKKAILDLYKNGDVFASPAESYVDFYKGIWTKANQ